MNLGAAGLLPEGLDETVRVSAADTLSAFLDTKISAGVGISLAILNPGANESLEITNTGAAENHQGTYDASSPARAVLSAANGPGLWRDIGSFDRALPNMATKHIRNAFPVRFLEAIYKK